MWSDRAAALSAVLLMPFVYSHAHAETMCPWSLNGEQLSGFDMFDGPRELKMAQVPDPHGRWIFKQSPEQELDFMVYCFYGPDRKAWPHTVPRAASICQVQHIAGRGNIVCE